MATQDGPVPGDWNPIKALENLTMERAFAGNDKTPQQIAKKLMEENLPVAVMALCHIATYGESEAMRFNASRYIVERTMGPAERQAVVDGRHAWDDIYEKVVSEAEKYIQQ